MNNGKIRGTMLTSTALILCCVTFAAGFLCGDLVSEYRRPAAVLPTPTPSPAPQTVQEAAQKENGAERSASHIAELRAQVAKDPSNAQLWTHLGNVCYDSGDADGAIEAYGRSLELAPGNADVMTDMGSMYRMKGKPAEAVKLYEQALAVSPGHANAVFNKGVTIMLDMGRPAEAMTFWRSVLAEYPELSLGSGVHLHAVLHEIATDAAMQFESRQRVEEALSAYAEALKIRPEYLPALVHSAWLMEDLGRKAEALPLWKRVLEIKPDALDPSGKPVRDRIR